MTNGIVQENVRGITTPTGFRPMLRGRRTKWGLPQPRCGWKICITTAQGSHRFLLDLRTDLEPEAPHLPPSGHPLLHSEWRRGMGRGGAPVHGKLVPRNLGPEAAIPL